MESIVAISSCGRCMGLGATMLLGFMWTPTRIVSISTGFACELDPKTGTQLSCLHLLHPPVSGIAVTSGSLCKITDITPQTVFLGNPRRTHRDHLNLKPAEGTYPGTGEPRRHASGSFWSRSLAIPPPNKTILSYMYFHARHSNITIA